MLCVHYESVTGGSSFFLFQDQAQTLIIEELGTILLLAYR